MNKNKGALMESVIENLLNQINLEIDPGVTHEINHNLKSQQSVIDFEISAKEGDIYEISIQLREFSKSAINDVFYSLLRFIQYNNVFYSSKTLNEGIRYVLLSFRDDNVGFCCEINFKGR
jgi:hypothetical protein